MERYHPRAGLWCLIVAFPTWAVFLINGMLGFFPAVFFADGGVGQKFHFWLFLKDRFFGGSPDPVWSEAGAMTSQEWILFALALPATLGAIYCLRRRPEFGAIEKSDDVGEREALEFGGGGIIASTEGDAHTQSIVESVIGEAQTVDENVVSAALGEMGEIAAANAAAQAEEAEMEVEEEPIMDSRFTTTIPDEETTEMVEAYIQDEQEDSKEEDDIGWGVWDPEEDAKEEVAESEVESDLPEIPEIFREPVSAVDALDEKDPLTVPSIPEIPEIVALEEAKPNISERISSMANQAADATVSATKEVVSATVTGAKEVASIAAGIKDKVVDKVRKKSTTGVMPVRPPGLPTMAEWDPYQGVWTLMGRPVQVASVPEPEPITPAWAQAEQEIPIETHPEQTQEEMPQPRRKTPFIPELP